MIHHVLLLSIRFWKSVVIKFLIISQECSKRSAFGGASGITNDCLLTNTLRSKTTQEDDDMVEQYSLAEAKDI
jgi:hypothetical protein